MILLPFLGKAHTIDDVTFLLQAEHVLQDPLHPTAFEMLSDGNRVRLSSLMVSGPAMAYLLVPSVLLGGAEWAAHLVQFLLVIAAILATVSLAMRLGIDRRGARVAGLMIASTPAVMGMATTSMPDVPAMAFAVLGMERFFAWRQERRWHQGFAAALGFALAILSRPHLVLLLAVAALSLLIIKTGAKNHVPAPIVFDRRPAPFIPGRFVEAIPLIVAVFITILAAVLTSDPGRIHGDFLRAALSRFAQSKIATNLAAFFLHWVLVFPLALVWIAMGIRWKTLWRNPAIYLALGVSFYIVLLDKKNHWVPATVLFLAFVGAFLILDILLGFLATAGWRTVFPGRLAPDRFACNRICAASFQVPDWLRARRCAYPGKALWQEPCGSRIRFVSCDFSRSCSQSAHYRSRCAVRVL